MNYTTDMLMKRICDVETDCENSQTYIEYIAETLEEHGMEFRYDDIETDQKFTDMMNFCDMLWEK